MSHPNHAKRDRVRLALRSKGSLFDDGVAMDRHHYGLCHECGAEWDEYGDDVSAQIVVCPECGSLDVSEIGCEE